MNIASDSVTPSYDATKAENIETIRLSVRQLCEKFGEDYWLDMDLSLIHI